jgi:D-arabinose 1-dehydrogenase-like Zn-dependent alcohol dehydrogenase
MRNAMKAAIVEKIGTIAVRDVPEPRPGDYEALCELLYGATCTGTDLHIIDGGFPWTGPLPTVIGHESVGRVVRVGAKVRHFRVGDLVTRCGMPAPPDGRVSVTWGGFTEFGIAYDHWAMSADGLPPDQWQGHRVNQVVPPGVDPRVVPMFTTWRETLSYLRRMGVKPGASILIVGSGGNAFAFAVHAANLGASRVAMVGALRMETAARTRAGVHTYLDYRSGTLASLLTEACPEGFDSIIDAVGRVGIADRVLPGLKPVGIYGTYGVADFGKIVISPSKARGGFTVYACSYDEAETHQAVSEFLRQGRLDASLWYDLEKPFPLDEIEAAFAHVRARRSLKALVRLRG